MLVPGILVLFDASIYLILSAGLFIKSFHVKNMSIVKKQCILIITLSLTMIAVGMIDVVLPDFYLDKR